MKLSSLALLATPPEDWTVQLVAQRRDTGALFRRRPRDRPKIFEGFYFTIGPDATIRGKPKEPKETSGPMHRRLLCMEVAVSKEDGLQNVLGKCPSEKGSHESLGGFRVSPLDTLLQGTVVADASCSVVNSRNSGSPNQIKIKCRKGYAYLSKAVSLRPQIRHPLGGEEGLNHSWQPAITENQAKALDDFLISDLPTVTGKCFIQLEGTLSENGEFSPSVWAFGESAVMLRARLFDDRNDCHLHYSTGEALQVRNKMWVVAGMKRKSFDVAALLRRNAGIPYSKKDIFFPFPKYIEVRGWMRFQRMLQGGGAKNPEAGFALMEFSGAPGRRDGKPIPFDELLTRAGRQVMGMKEVVDDASITAVVRGDEYMETVWKSDLTQGGRPGSRNPKSTLILSFLVEVLTALIHISKDGFGFPELTWKNISIAFSKLDKRFMHGHWASDYRNVKVLDVQGVSVAASHDFWQRDLNCDFASPIIRMVEDAASKYELSKSIRYRSSILRGIVQLHGGKVPWLTQLTIVYNLCGLVGETLYDQVIPERLNRSLPRYCGFTPESLKSFIKARTTAPGSEVFSRIDPLNVMNASHTNEGLTARSTRSTAA